MTIFFVAIMVAMPTIVSADSPPQAQAGGNANAGQDSSAEWTYTVGPVTIDTSAGAMVGSYGATITGLVSLSFLIYVTSGVLFIVGTLLVRRAFRG